MVDIYYYLYNRNYDSKRKFHLYNQTITTKQQKLKPIWLNTQRLQKHEKQSKQASGEFTKLINECTKHKKLSFFILITDHNDSKNLLALGLFFGSGLNNLGSGFGFGFESSFGFYFRFWNGRRFRLGEFVREWKCGSCIEFWWRKRAEFRFRKRKLRMGIRVLAWDFAVTGKRWTKRKCCTRWCRCHGPLRLLATR